MSLGITVCISYVLALDIKSWKFQANCQTQLEDLGDGGKEALWKVATKSWLAELAANGSFVFWERLHLLHFSKTYNCCTEKKFSLFIALLKVIGNSMNVPSFDRASTSLLDTASISIFSETIKLFFCSPHFLILFYAKYIICVYMHACCMAAAADCNLSPLCVRIFCQINYISFPTGGSFSQCFVCVLTGQNRLI